MAAHEAVANTLLGGMHLVAVVELVWVLVSSYAVARTQVAEAMELLLRGEELTVECAESGGDEFGGVRSAWSVDGDSAMPKRQ